MQNKPAYMRTMIIIYENVPTQELEEKIIAFLKQEHIDVKRIFISSQNMLTFPGLIINGMSREVMCMDKKLPLTRLEYDLLLVLASCEGKVFSKGELFAAVWGENCEDTLKVVANTISNLRKKMGKSTGCRSYIQTVHGGYAFSVQ